MIRVDSRLPNELRQVNIIKHFMPNSYGSCLIGFGNTRVLVSASVSIGVPPFLEGSDKGWVTAEYAMLPGSTFKRKSRDRFKTDARSIEIGRFVGRSVRANLDLTALYGLTINIDCDVIEADGGTRTASVTGAFIALSLCVERLLSEGTISRSPIKDFFASVSAGILGNTPLLDLSYIEDSNAEADMNFVATEDDIIEIQLSGEKRPISDSEFLNLITLCKDGVKQLIEIEKKVLEN